MSPGLFFIYLLIDIIIKSILENKFRLFKIAANAHGWFVWNILFFLSPHDKNAFAWEAIPKSTWSTSRGWKQLAQSSKQTSHYGSLHKKTWLFSKFPSSPPKNLPQSLHVLERWHSSAALKQIVVKCFFIEAGKPVVFQMLQNSNPAPLPATQWQGIMGSSSSAGRFPNHKK